MSVTDESAPHGYEADGVTAKAPYGYRADGMPKKLPGRPLSAAGVKPPAPKKPGTKKAGPPSYVEGILGLAQIPIMGLAFLGTKNEVFTADAAAVSMHIQPFAEALNSVAHEQPAVAAMLDRALTIGPYGLVLAAVVPAALQVCANHGWIPPGFAGTVSKEEVLTALIPVGEEPLMTMPQPAAA